MHMNIVVLGVRILHLAPHIQHCSLCIICPIEHSGSTVFNIVPSHYVISVHVLVQITSLVTSLHHIRLVDHATLSVRLNFCNGYANSSYVYLSVIRKIDCILFEFVYFPAMQFSSSRLYSYSRSAAAKQSYLRALQSSAYRHAFVANCFH